MTFLGLVLLIALVHHANSMNMAKILEMVANGEFRQDGADLTCKNEVTGDTLDW